MMVLMPFAFLFFMGVDVLGFVLVRVSVGHPVLVFLFVRMGMVLVFVPMIVILLILVMMMVASALLPVSVSMFVMMMLMRPMSMSVLVAMFMLVLLVRMDRACVDAEFRALHLLPFGTVEVHVKIADIELGKLPFECRGLYAQVAQRADRHVAADAREAIEEEDLHRKGDVIC
jgi:hypothetical protein